MAVFESDTTIQASAEDIFAFMIQPQHLVKISPPDMGLKFLEAPERLELGVTIRFMVQTMGQVQKITHKITQFEDPHHFVEELVEGPLPLWVHTHSFTALGEGQTIVCDRIEFEPPGGLIGLLLTENRILDHLDDAFHHRHQQLHKLFG